jgi:SAM-dependent methyltransferase
VLTISQLSLESMRTTVRLIPPSFLNGLLRTPIEEDIAWDCACGSGQATTGLSQRFQKVIATDLSPSQLSHAPKLPNVFWKVARAEDSGIDDSSIDLVTVAQALHWFDRDQFWREVHRVLRPNGLIAVWSYGIASISHAEVSSLVDRFYSQEVGQFWPSERKIVEQGYDELDFPFNEIQAPAFQLKATWSLEQLMGYISSWSATQIAKKSTGIDPIPELRKTVESVFPSESVQLIWPISIRVGRLP